MAAFRGYHTLLTLLTGVSNFQLVVLTPDREEEIPGLLQVCIDHGLTLIPRGGGTGYTGGSIPLDKMSAVLNTEKLEQLSSISNKTLPGSKLAVPVDYCWRRCSHKTGV